MDREPKRFTIEGAVLKREHLLRKQFHEEMRLKKRMFKQGYVPVLDIVPIVNEVYNKDKGTIQYMITMYGVKTEDDVWKYEGYLTDRFIRASTRIQFERLWERSGLM